MIPGLVVDRSSALPLYQQVKEALMSAIGRGVFQEGERLPTEAEFCQQLEVSRITVTRALEELARDGLITRVQGKGSFLSARKVAKALGSPQGFSAVASQQGFSPRSNILEQRLVDIPENYRAAFGLTPHDRGPVIYLRRVRYLNELPVVISASYFHPGLTQPLSGVDLSHSIYVAVSEALLRPLIREEQVLNAVGASKADGDVLGIPPGFPCFRSETRTYADQAYAHLVSTSLFRGDRVQFHANQYQFI